MSWQEPGRDRDPWREDPGGGDLDEMLRRLRRRLAAWFSLRPGSPRRNIFRIWWLAPLVLIGIWLLTGFYQVSDGSKGVRLQFGAFMGEIGPGVHWHWPWPIDQVYVVNVTEPRSVSQRQEVLTKDGKLVTIDMTIRYRIADPYSYLFGVNGSSMVLNALAADAIASSARDYPLASLSGERQSETESSLEHSIAQSLAAMHTGLLVDSVAFSRIGYPKSVTKAENELNAERTAAASQVTAARAAAEDALSMARERAHAIVAGAQAGGATEVSRAQAEVAAFRQLLPAWRADPKMIREMLREHAVSAFLQSAPKVVVVGPIHSVSIPGWPASSERPAAVSTKARVVKPHGGGR